MWPGVNVSLRYETLAEIARRSHSFRHKNEHHHKHRDVRVSIGIGVVADRIRRRLCTHEADSQLFVQRSRNAPQRDRKRVRV